MNSAKHFYKGFSRNYPESYAENMFGISSNAVKAYAARISKKKRTGIQLKYFLKIPPKIPSEIETGIQEVFSSVNICWISFRVLFKTSTKSLKFQPI